MNIEKALTIDGFMSEPELLWLAKHVKKCQTVVEIGSWMGRSARAMADNMKPGSTLFCIDNWQGASHYYTQLTVKKLGGPDGLYKIFANNLSPHIKTGHVVPIRSPSADAIRLLTRHKKFPIEGADLIFIDGLHTFDAVLTDIANYSGLVKPKGLLVGHDINKRSVVHAVEEAFGLDYQRQDGKKPKSWKETRNHKAVEKIWWVQL